MEIEITLQQLLDAREERSIIQRQFIDKYNCPVLCLTVLAVGKIKRTEQTFFVAMTGQKEVLNAFPDIIDSIFVDKPTGIYAVFACKGQASILKEKAILLEESHPLGRLWDIDVIDGNYTPISRTSLGYGARKCLLCDNDAAICTRSVAHEKSQLQQRIDQIISKYTAKE